MKSRYIKELRSLRNKMSPDNLIWFDSLSTKLQFDFLFMWKKIKNYYKDLDKPEVLYIKGNKNITYPPNLKHYIKYIRSTKKFYVEKSKLRQGKILSILGENNN